MAIRYGRSWRLKTGEVLRYEYKGTMRRKQIKTSKGWVSLRSRKGGGWEFNPYSKTWGLTQRKNR